MHDPGRNEDRPRGTYGFPFEFHHITEVHPRYVMSYHWHIEYEIIQVISGNLELTLDEETYLVSPGDIVFVNSGVLHSGKPMDCVYECIVFDLNAFLRFHSVCAEYIQQIVHQEVRVDSFLSRDKTDLCRSAAEIFRAFRETRPGYELVVYGQFYNFFGKIFENHYFRSGVRAPGRNYRKVLQLKKAIEFIEKNYTGRITLEQLSDSVDMDPKYFCRFFSEMTHQTPMDYVNRQRIEQACSLLSAEAVSITDAAYQSGFNDLSYFIRIFRKYKGVTPGQYKKGKAGRSGSDIPDLPASNPGVTGEARDDNKGHPAP